jgi:hypothetical protein
MRCNALQRGHHPVWGALRGRSGLGVAWHLSREAADYQGERKRAVHGVPPARWRRNTYGLGRPGKHDRFAREHARRQRAQEDSVKRWVAETIERAEREGRRALPFRHSGLSD